MAASRAAWRFTSTSTSIRTHAQPWNALHRLPNALPQRDPSLLAAIRFAYILTLNIEHSRLHVGHMATRLDSTRLSYDCLRMHKRYCASEYTSGGYYPRIVPSITMAHAITCSIWYRNSSMSTRRLSDVQVMPHRSLSPCTHHAMDRYPYPPIHSTLHSASRRLPSFFT